MTCNACNEFDKYINTILSPFLTIQTMKTIKCLSYKSSKSQYSYYNRTEPLINLRSLSNRTSRQNLNANLVSLGNSINNIDTKLKDIKISKMGTMELKIAAMNT